MNTEESDEHIVLLTCSLRSLEDMLWQQQQQQQQDETRNYMYHLTYHGRNMSLYTLTVRSVLFISKMGVRMESLD
jgi:hypothetical protein